MKRSWAFSLAFGGASLENEAFRARHEAPRERNSITLLPFKPTLRNLESLRALHSAVVMFQNNGGRKETLSEREDRRELGGEGKKEKNPQSPRRLVS